MRKIMRQPIPVQQEQSSYSIQLFVLIFIISSHIDSYLKHFACLINKNILISYQIIPTLLQPNWQEYLKIIIQLEQVIYIRRELQQISINSKDCMILEMDKVRGFVNIPVYNIKWNEIFQSQLCNRNEQFRKNNPPINYKLSKGDAFINRIAKKFNKQKNCTLTIKTPKVSHSDYSNFVPLRNKCYADKNQCERQLTFLTHCDKKNYVQQKQKLQQLIKQNVANTKMFRQNISSKYNPFISFKDRVDMYVQLLSYGTKIFEHFDNLHSLIFQLTRISGVFQRKMKIKKNISITIDRESQINPQTISLTMKSLYCPLCLIYDCSIHNEHNLRVGPSGNCQYVSLKNKKKRMEHLKSSLYMLSIEGQQSKQQYKCSKQCYRNLIQLQKNPTTRMMLIVKQATMSDLTKSLISMGVQLFSFSPCQIKILLPENQLTCSQIYTYLENQYNTRSRILSKLFSNEQQMLINQGTHQVAEVPKQVLIHNKKKRNKIGTKFKPKNNRDRNKGQTTNQKSYNQAISICMHHFLNQSSLDQDCKNCICNQRGYCLPSCLCSDRCTIMKVGCHCKKGKKICNTNSCKCYESGAQCIPELCGKNCSGPQNCCSNEQIQTRKFKNVKISYSKIPMAGLGLYAGEAIPKDSLVTVYLGEKVDSFIIQLREKLRKNNSFYNFECNGVHLDSRYLGNKSRFINHSTTKLQNLRVRIVKSGGQDQIAFYATKDIEQGEQLYFDYDGDGELAKHHAAKYPFINPK